MKRNETEGDSVKLFQLHKDKRTKNTFNPTTQRRDVRRRPSETTLSPTNQSINQPTNQPTNQSINQSTNQSINQSTNQSINQSTNHQSTNQSTNQSINQPINQPTNQPINQSTINQSSTGLQTNTVQMIVNRMKFRYFMKNIAPT